MSTILGHLEFLIPSEFVVQEGFLWANYIPHVR